MLDLFSLPCRFYIAQSSQEDVWDDTALIQAYDRAVNLAKEKVAARLGLTDDQSSDNAVPNGGRDASPTKSSGSKKQSWKVGDYVRSTYSEDGVVYEAIIEKIIPSSSSCLIKYLGTVCLSNQVITDPLYGYSFPFFQAMTMKRKYCSRIWSLHKVQLLGDSRF